MGKITLSILMLFSLNAFSKPMKTMTAKEVYKHIVGTGYVSAETKQSVERHFRDSNRFYPDPLTLDQYPLPKARVIKGTNYMATPLIPWSYKFDIFLDNGTLVIRTKIHFKNVRADEILRMRERIKAAEDIWNKGAPQDVLSFKYRFQFDVVKNAKDAHISVGLLDDTRGPFFKNWSRTWEGVSIAHEIGHMMGLSDEYQEIFASGTNHGCDLHSIMCNGWWGEPEGYHYYHILRKVLK